MLTIIRILEAKGYVQHVKNKRAHIYLPKIDREDATRFEVRHLVSRFFGNSPQRLLLNILEESSIDAEELVRVREMIHQLRNRETSGNVYLHAVLESQLKERSS